jgi:N-acetylmuramoyl-L-alanine amidase
MESIELMKKGYHYKFAIVVGHEKTQKGAKAGPPLNVHEYDFNKEIAQLMYVFAREKSMDARVFYRDGIGIGGVGDAVNRWGADVAIELHFNSATESARGTVTLYDANPADNKEYATVIQRYMCELFKRTGKTNRGIKLLESCDRGHYNTASIKCISVLVEPFFGSNKDDCQLMWSNATGYARCLVAGTIEFLNDKEKGEIKL